MAATRKRSRSSKIAFESNATSPSSQETLSLSSSNARHYNDADYWETRYRHNLVSTSTANNKNEEEDEDKDVTDEWYYSFSSLLPLLKSYLTPSLLSSPVLDVGCGVSNLFTELINYGFTNDLLGIDYSITCIQHQQQRYPSHLYPQLHYKLDNLFKFDRHHKAAKDIYHHYGLIIDKATSDGIMCSNDNIAGIIDMYTMIGWALQPGGLFVCCSVQLVDSRWFTELVLPSLYEGDSDYRYHIVVHSLAESEYYDGEKEGPNVYLIQKLPRKRRRRRCRLDAEDNSNNDQIIIQKLH